MNETPLNNQTERTAAEHAESSLADFEYNYSWEYFRRNTDHFSKLDGKAASLGGFIGVMLTVVLTLAPDVFPAAKFQPNLGAVSQVLYVISSVLMAVALFYCVVSLRLRMIEDCPKAAELLGRAREMNKGTDVNQAKAVEIKLKRKVAEHLAKAGQQFQEQSSFKEAALKRTNATLIAGVGCLVASGILFIIHITLNQYAGK